MSLVLGDVPYWRLAFLSPIRAPREGGVAENRDRGSWSTRVYASSIAERDRTDTGRVNVVEVMSEEPGLSDSDNYAQSYTYVSMSPQNNIGCRGPLPPFPLLPPYLTTDFRDLQHMCAVAFSGGNP